MLKQLTEYYFNRSISIDYLKADIEGAEMAMLKGACPTIKLSKPRIALTLYHIGHNVNEIVTYLRLLVTEYNHRVKGINVETGNPVMGHFWI